MRRRAFATALNSDTLIEIDHVTFGYDASRTILHDVSMKFQRGKVTAIMGGSGCGKTTLLRLIAGVYPANKGRVIFDGETVNTQDKEHLYRLRRRLGMLFQFGALFTDLSVFENVAFPLREHTELSDTMIRDIVLMKLNAVGLRGAAHLRISEVSGGMARRIALARAMALDPELIMYDEPFAGLDPISLNHIVHLIRELNEALGLTSIVVTYDVKEALTVADYCYVICDGVVLGRGTPDEIRNSSSPYLRQFVNALPDGPVRFHFPGAPIDAEIGLRDTPEQAAASE